MSPQRIVFFASVMALLTLGWAGVESDGLEKPEPIADPYEESIEFFDIT